MRTHLGCTGSVALGLLSDTTQDRLEQVQASWLEYTPEDSVLVVRHVQPDDLPALREIAGELLDFLRALTDRERAGVPGGALYCQDEETGQYTRLKVVKGGFLTVSWASPDYRQAEWVRFQNQPVDLVLDFFQKLNGQVSFKGHPNAADDLRRTIERTTGPYSHGEYAINSSVDRVELSLRDFNSDALTLVNALRYLDKTGTLVGEIDVASFRAGDLEDYCRFAFRAGEVWVARPKFWAEDQGEAAADAKPVSKAA